MSLDLVKVGKRVLNEVVPDRLSGVANAALGFLSPMKQPQLAYMWEIEFIDPVTGDANNTLKYYAKAAAIPPVIHETIKRYYMGVEYSYASKDISPRVFRCTFYDNQSLEAYRFFYRWKELCNSGEDARMMNPESYKTQVTLILKDTSDSIVNDRFYMLDCYPTEISEVALSYNTSEEITFDVMLSFSTMRIL
jgi:hypothetical protein